MTIGERIRVNSHHWSRANAMGTIAEFNAESKNNNRYLIEFEKPGAGIDGKYLWLSEDQFTVADAAPPVKGVRTWSRTDHAK